MTQGSVPPPPRRRLAGVITVAGAGALAALAAARTAPWRSSAAPPPPYVAPPAISTEIDAVATDVVPPEGTASPPDTHEETVSEATTDQGTLQTKTPPCRQYYPACGTFSRSGTMADVECGCRADETCSRAGATGRCVHRPRWMGPWPSLP
jgi:hypothetical protein